LPKPTQELPTNAEAVTEMPSPVIELATRMRETGSLVMTRPKPEKRLNAKDRAKARREKDKPEAADDVAVTPKVNGLSTAHPKPEKRKNAKERAREKYAKAKTEDGTTPMTAKAKSKVEAKAEVKKAKKAAKVA
jgi:hypothetical protein